MTGKLFPYADIFKWMSYGNGNLLIPLWSCLLVDIFKMMFVCSLTLPLECLSVDGKHPACDKSYFGRREFSFTLDNDIYLRFQSFNSLFELENSIKEKCPFKIDIGPVYSVDVRFSCLIIVITWELFQFHAHDYLSIYFLELISLTSMLFSFYQGFQFLDLRITTFKK